MKRITFAAFLTAILFLQISAKKPYKITGEPITFLTDGGWCWYQDPRAIIQNGKLIIGAISGQSGDIRIGVYDLKTNKNLGVAVLDENFEIDDHNSPVFHARPDGSLIAMWAEHGKKNCHYYSISSPNDYLNWSERKIQVHDYEMPVSSKWYGVTYTNLYTLDNQGLLYNFFRHGITYNPTLMTSSDNGNSWSSDTHFIADEVDGRNRPYAKYMQVSNNKIGISFTDGHPRNYGNSIYYVNFDGTSFYNADGKKIKDLSDGPLLTSEADKIYTGSETQKKPEGFGSIPNAAWTCEVERDKKERPYIGYTLYLNDDDNRFRLANWTGSAWNDREIAYAGKHLYKGEDSYTGLLAFDPIDPSKIVISSDVNPSTGEDTGGVHELYMAKLKDSDKTGTIQWQQLTVNSKYKNIRPIIVSGEGYKVLLWVGNKPWRHFQDYESDILGYILENPKR